MLKMSDKSGATELANREIGMPLMRAEWIYAGVCTVLTTAGRYYLLEKAKKGELLNWGNLIIFPLALFSGKISSYTQQTFPSLPVHSGTIIVSLGAAITGKTLFSYNYMNAGKYGLLAGTSFMAAEYLSDTFLDTTNYVKDIIRPQ